MDLICLGNLITDDLVFADGTTHMGLPGGAVIYSALGARLWGRRVGVVSVAGEDYSYRMLEGLARRGIDITGIRRVSYPGLRAWLIYEPGGRRLLHRLDSPPHAQFSPGIGDLPAHAAGARAFHISPMPLDSQQALAEAIAAREHGVISIDPHEPVHVGNLERWRRVLDHADVFLPSEGEIALAGMAEDPLTALAPFSRGRLRFVALKRGARGGLLCDLRERRTHAWPAARVKVLDPTGAGDSFGGGFLAGWLATGEVEDALERGVISAGVALEGLGVQGFMGVSPELAEQRRREQFAGHGLP
jgi:ribokinase